jgi:subtilisin family serine protease
LAGRLGRAWDYVDDDNDPTDRRDGKDNDNDGLTDEAFGHGTHVAGIVALVAPDATILPSRVLDADGRGNVFLVAQAIADVVEDGADVINLSFGTEDNTDSKLLKDAISHAQHQGIVVVASAGNNGSTARRFPASAHNVIAVAGAGAAATGLASFSNRGTWVRVAAPSTDIVSAIPGGGYAAWSGTSMAAPFVSGEAALIKQSSRKSDPKTVLDAIFGSLTKFRTGQKDDPGLVDLVASLRRTR